MSVASGSLVSLGRATGVGGGGVGAGGADMRFGGAESLRFDPTSSLSTHAETMI